MASVTLDEYTASLLRAIDDKLDNLEAIYNGETDLPTDRVGLTDKLCQVAYDYADTLRQVQAKVIANEIY